MKKTDSCDRIRQKDIKRGGVAERGGTKREMSTRRVIPRKKGKIVERKKDMEI